MLYTHEFSLNMLSEVGNKASETQKSQSSPKTINTNIEWIKSYFNNYIAPNPKIEPCLLTSQKRKDNPIVIVLLQFRSFRRKLLNFREIEIFGRGPTDFYDLQICGEEDYDDLMVQLVTWLFVSKTRWDKLELSELPNSFYYLEKWLLRATQLGFKPEVAFNSGYYSVDTTKCWDSYQNDFLKNESKDLMKDLRKIEKRGNKIVLESHRENVFFQLTRVLHLYAQRRSSLGQKNTYETPERQGFVRDVIEAYEKKGWVELTFLKDQEGNTWAFQLDWLYEGVRYHWNHAYNEDFKKYSPGKILLYLIMKRSFEDPNERECNHMRGLAGYKSKLANQMEPLVSITIKNPYSIRNKVIDFYHRISYLKLFITKRLKTLSK